MQGVATRRRELEAEQLAGLQRQKRKLEEAMAERTAVPLRVVGT